MEPAGIDHVAISGGVNPESGFPLANEAATAQVREVEIEDLESLFELIGQSELGLTTLKISRQKLQARIEDSHYAFVRSQNAGYMLFCNNTSLRIASETLLGYTRMKKDGKMQQATPCTIGTKVRETKGDVYHVPVINKCSEPIAIGEDMMALVQEQIVEFMSAKDRTGPEKVEKKTSRKR